MPRVESIMISILSSDILTIKKISWDVAHCCPTVLSPSPTVSSPKNFNCRFAELPWAAIQHELESKPARFWMPGFPQGKLLGWERPNHTTTRQHNKRHNILPCESKNYQMIPKTASFLFCIIAYVYRVFLLYFFWFFSIFFWLDLSQDWGAAHLFGMEIGLVGKFLRFLPGRVMWLPLTIQTSTAEAENVWSIFCIRLNFFTIFSSSEWVKNMSFLHMGLFHQLHAAPNILGQNIRRMTGLPQPASDSSWQV